MGLENQRGKKLLSFGLSKSEKTLLLVFCFRKIGSPVISLIKLLF
ncbi:MAG: hypothetical protein ACPLRX_03690 [Candidatus Saccharicenans sp.]